MVYQSTVPSYLKLALTYKIAKFLLGFVQPFTTNEFTVKDSFHFVSILEGKDHRLIMASLDVESLFTNIPLAETITIVTEKVFEKKRKVNGISRGDFRRLLEITTAGTVLFRRSVLQAKGWRGDGFSAGPCIGERLPCTS